MTTNVNDNLFLYRQPTQHLDQITALPSTPPYSGATEPITCVSTATVIPSEITTEAQATVTTAGQTASQGSSHSVVQVSAHPPHTRIELEAGSPGEWDGSENELGVAGQVADNSDTGVKSVVSRIIAVLKTYEDITDNDSKESVADTIDQLTSLEHTTVHQTDDLNQLKRRDKLQSALGRISEDLGQTSNDTAKEGISKSAHDEDVLVGYVEDICEALFDYEMLDLHPMAEETIASTARPAISPELTKKGIRGASREVNPPRPGFFAGAKNVDASHGIFTDVAGDVIIAGDVNFKVENQGNDMSTLDKLPRAKDAGYRCDHHRKCLTGTRIAELEHIEKWEVDYADKRVYWLNGLTGTGKSTIAKTFAERSSAEGRLGASFFCSRDFPDRRNIHLIFPTLAFGLAQQYAQFREALIKVLRSNPDAGDESLAVQLESLLVGPLKSTQLSTTIVIDALDECEDNEPASAILSLLAQHIDLIPSVKFFITGRPEVPIRTGFRLPLLKENTEVFVLHDVSQSSVDQDIELYLRTRLSEIAKERSHLDLTGPWPADDDIAVLVKRCSGMFIVASITARLIGDRRLDPQEQLKVIIKEAESTVREGKSGIDETYHQVFLRSLIGVDILDNEFFDRLRLVVGSILLAFNPLSCADLAKILDISRGRVMNAVRLLHSVLIVPESNTGLLRICHKSFADFLTDPSRCVDTRFYIEPSILHTKLGMQCLTLMKEALKKNICHFPPYALNRDIGDLDARRDRFIGGGLEYACRSWARHLRFASRDGDNVGRVVKLLEYFFKHHLLSWLEVLSIVGDMRCAVYSLRDVKGWFIAVGSPDANLLDIVKDSERFILRFLDAIKASACHLYHSALPWSPRSSLVRRLYEDQMSSEVKMLNAIDDSWDASTRRIETRDDVHCMAFSHSDEFIAAGEISCVEVFETLTGHHRATFTWPYTTGFCWTLSFSLNDTLLATGHSDGKISVWDLQTGGLICSFEGHAGIVQSVAFSPSGTMIASCSRDRTVRIWTISSRDCRCVLEGHSEWVWSVCWSAMGDEVISGSYDSTVRVWDVDGRRWLKTFSGCIAVGSSDSSFIASGSFASEVKVFSVQTGDVFRTIPTDGLVESIRFRDQDTLMYATDESTFVIHDLTKTTSTPRPKSKSWLKRHFQKAWIGFKSLQGQMHHSKTNVTKDANALMFKYFGDKTAISSGGTRIASRTGSQVVAIWQTDGPSPNHDMASHHDKVESVAFAGDGQLVASGSWDKTAKLWDPTTPGRCLHTFNHPDRVKLVVFSPDSTLLSSVTTSDATIRIWNTHTHKLISTLKNSSNLVSHYDKSLGFSPNGTGNRLVSLERRYTQKDGHSALLELWEVATGQRLASMELDGFFAQKVAFGVDGTSVILERSSSPMRYRISPIRSSSNDDKDGHSSLPMEFFVLHDTQEPILHLPSLRLTRESEWILDEQERRVLWVPPDLLDGSDAHGKKVVLGSESGKVAFLDFSDLEYCQRSV